MSDTATSPRAEDAPRVAWRMQLAVYGAATFSNSLGYMIMVVVPLWVVTLHVSPLMVGVILGSRHFLVLLYSIHGGAMMDRLDVRRVMVSFAVTGVALPFLYPLLPYVGAMIVLQMIAGYCTASGWMGAQAVIGQAMKGSAVHTGRMSAAVRLGALIGPPIAGAAWDLGGPWGAFSALAFWGLGMLASCLLLPAPRDAESGGKRPPPRLRDLVPHPSDYVAALRMLAIPIVAVVMAVAILRIAGFGIQSTFYAVLLERRGYSGTTIGLLLALYSLVGGAASLWVGQLTRRFSPAWLMIVMVGISVAAVMVTPLMGNFAALALASAVNGGSYGLSQPLMITLTSKVVGRDNQGKAIGLRTTANRLAATFMPVIMGAVVQWTGLDWGFYLTGGVVLALLAMVAIGARGAIRRSGY